MLAVGLIKNIDKSSSRQDEIAAIPELAKETLSGEGHEGGDKTNNSAEANSLYNNKSQ